MLSTLHQCLNLESVQENAMIIATINKLYMKGICRPGSNARRVMVGMAWLGVLMLSVPVHAEPVADGTDGTDRCELCLESHGDEIIDDGVLAHVHGKGVGKGTDQTDQFSQLAVILWDERGSGTQGNPRNGADGNNNVQNVSLTLNYR